VLTRVRSLVERREILRLLIGRDLKVKYAKSVLGYFWSVLDPLLMAGVYWFVFSVIFTRGVGDEPYILFLVLGMLPWNWAQGVIHDSSRALTRDAKLVRSSNLNREVWVLRVVGSKAMEFLLSVPVILLFVVLYRKAPSLELLAFPLAVLIQSTFLVGVGLILAPVTVLFNDVQRLVRIVTRILFYLSPVIYGVRDVYERAPEWVHPLYVLNPLAGIFDLYRASFFPDHFVGWTEVAVAAAVSVGFLLLGMFTFSRLEGRVLKEI
jgi:ABC-2 type transport system permease protein